MTEFMQIVLQYLLLAAAAGAAALTVTWIFLRLGGNSGRSQQDVLFRGEKTVVLFLLLAYLAVLAWVTVLSRPQTYQNAVNLHWFRSVAMAWNTAAQYAWLNILLNIAMFMPLGLVVRLVPPRYRRSTTALLAGLLLSSLVELIQYHTHRGFLDVDDLWCNTLGAFLGGCMVIGLEAALRKQWARVAKAMLPPILAAAAVGAFFLAYQLQPYGNLPYGPDIRINTRGIEWKVENNLPEEPARTMIYRAPSFTKDSADGFAEAFSRTHQLNFTESSRYDGSSVYYDAEETCYLLLLYRDGSWLYQAEGFRQPASRDFTQAQVREILQPYGIAIPEGATFEITGEDSLIFRADQIPAENGIYDGAVRCRIRRDGRLLELEQYLNFHAQERMEDIYSPAEAFENLRRGNFACSNWDLKNPPEQCIVTGWELSYQVDTKGFLRPVYLFSVTADGTALEERLQTDAM